MGTTLFHFPPSLCSQKVRLALAEKGVDWTSRLVNIGPPLENYEPWYARLNPRMVVPTLQHDDTVVTDSARIIRYIDEHYPGPDLSGGARRDEVDEYIRLQDGLKIREIVYSPKPGLIGMLSKGSFEKRLATLARHAAANPDLEELYTERVREVRRWREVSHSPEQVAAELQRVKDAVARVDDAVADSEFLVGDTYTLADVAWTVILARLEMLKLSSGWADEAPNVARYYARMKSRPTFVGADIWNGFQPLTMLPIVWQVLKHRLSLDSLST